MIFRLNIIPHFEIIHQTFFQWKVRFIKLIIIFTVCSFVIIVGTISVIIYCKKKKKNDLKVVDITRKSRLLSALGLEVENEEGLILDNDDEDEENNNLIDKDKNIDYRNLVKEIMEANSDDDEDDENNKNNSND